MAKIKRFNCITVSLVVTMSLLALYAGSVYDRKPKHEFTEHPKQHSDMDVTETVLQGYFNVERKQALHEKSFQPIQLSIRRNDSFDYKDAMRKLNEEKVAPDDPRLVELIRNYYIIPPSEKPYGLADDLLDYSMGQSPLVDSALNFMEGGFYVESGACNGEWGTNTLFFEKVRQWNGVLIEAEPSNFNKLLGKHRKAFIINACLSSTPYPSKVVFVQNFNTGRIVSEYQNQAVAGEEVEVQCFPLYSILLALNQYRVDLLSLDVDGAEIDVLSSIPLDKVDINMMAVDCGQTPGGAEALKTFGRNNGFQWLFELHRFNGRAYDVIFKNIRS